MRFNSALAAVFLVLAPFAASPDAAAQTPKTIRVNPSADTVSSWSEIPAGDHLIKDSHIYVGGRGGATRWLALIGVAIDHSRNEAAIAGAADKLRIKFDSLLMPTLAALEERNAIPEAKFVSATEPYEVKLLPSARFQVEDDGKAFLTFRITARLRLDPTSREITKNYYYGVAGLRALDGEGGWIENDAELVRTASKAAFARLLEAVAYDAAGRFKEAMLPGKQRFVTLRVLYDAKLAPKAVLLAELADSFIVVPIVGERQIYQVVQVIDRAAINTDVPIESSKPPEN